MPYPLLVLLFLCFLTPGFGQSAQSDSVFVTVARNQAITAYEQDVREQAHIFEGNEYIAHDHRIKIHPFYRTDSLQTGTILYNGVRYKGIPMLYDIVRQEVAIQPPGGGYRLRVRNEYISAFSLGAHQFSRITRDPRMGDTTAGVPTGFYEILYDGRIKALSHRIKTVHEDISSGSYQAEYLKMDRFYIQKEGRYHEVKSKRSLLNLLPDQSKALRKFIRANNLKFNNEQREEAVSRVTQRYDELTK